MTHSQRRKACYLAAEKIAAGGDRYSCFALSDSGGDKIEYGNFYGMSPDDIWLGREKGWTPPPELINIRIMLLLWYAELGIEAVR
jgi:hypothetical protein